MNKASFTHTPDRLHRTAGGGAAIGTQAPLNTTQACLIATQAALFRWLALAVLVVLLTGCRDEDLDTTYGMRSGIYGGKSINGTAVLAEMFDQAGHSVSSRSYLSPKTAEADVIVWFPNNFQPPNEKIREWLTDWLEVGGHTLIYVARDYDSEPDYWPEVIPRMPANQQAEGKLRGNEAQQSFDNDRKELPDDADAEWFSIDGKAQPVDVKKLSGPWAAGIDAAKANIKLNSRIEPADWAELLLETDNGDMLVSREWWNYDEDLGQRPSDSKLIVVANGSFLLNYPLVNHEHRKLAGKLIGEVPDDARVVFLEGAEPPIRDEEPKTEAPTGMEMFAIWPMNWILVHLGVLGTFFLLARWPIFGLPRSLPRDPQADFGKHVSALGELLANTRDRTFAIARLQHYRQLTKKDVAEKPTAQKPAEKG